MEQRKPLTTIEKIDAIGNVMDKLTDARGREKCSLILLVSNIMEEIKGEVLIMEDQLNDLTKAKGAEDDGNG